MFARAVSTALERAGHTPSIAGTLAAAQAAVRSPSESPDVVLLDARLPDGDGLDLLGQRGDDDGAPAMIVMTAYGEIAQAIRAMKSGALDYLKKPVDLNELLMTVEKAVRSERLRARLRYSRARETHAEHGGQLLGESKPLRAARAEVQRVARVGGDRPPHVLIQGETGTGKDICARLVHRLGPRADRPFVHVDCTSLPKDIMEAELFGHARGAFTSAHTARAGLIETAEDGTVFLDEIGELPMTMQAKLLNVLERRQLRRVGSTREVPAMARFIAATNRDLPTMVARGAFRDDLYYRLNVLGVVLPPLRDCSSDIPLLAHHFLTATARNYGYPAPHMHDDAMATLRAYRWPGNVRELKNVVERAALLGAEDGIRAASFGFPEVAPGSSRRLARALGEATPVPIRTLLDAEREMIEAALVEANGNTSLAARQLGITRMALRYRAEKHGLQPDDYCGRRQG
jgi:DNA-binding NtrC family response regulator